MAGRFNTVTEEIQNSIRLVSFASDECTKSLANTVCELGHRVEFVQNDTWLDYHEDTSGNTIVLIENEDFVRSNILHSFGRSRGSGLLGVFCFEANGWDKQIVRNCPDFVFWPCSRFEIQCRIERIFCCQHVSNLVWSTDNLSEKIKQLKLIGESDVFVSAMSELSVFADCDAPVLIQGETGTGKELAAQAVHALSERCDKPFVAVNCGAIPDNLFENELFGHEKGAFTDAKESQKGLVAQAQGGTLFLDEIDALSPMAQVALLRFLEVQEYRPLGGQSVKIADTRIITATNARLTDLRNSTMFRQDLLFRLDVFEIRLPPLRERGFDIDLLTQHFLQRYALKYGKPEKSLHPGMLDWMREYEWKGNVRELDNFIHRAFLLSKTKLIFMPKPSPGQSTSASSQSRGMPWRNLSFKEAKNNTLEQFEKSYITWLMSETHGNLSMAARKTGQQRSSLRKLLHKHGIDKNAWRPDLQ